MGGFEVLSGDALTPALSRREVKKVVVGVGARPSCGVEEIVALVRRACAEAGCVPSVLAAPAFRGEVAGLAAAALGVELVLVSEAELEAAQVRCVTRSAAALAAVGVASVAEGCALAAAGESARLSMARVASGAATCAVAEG